MCKLFSGFMQWEKVLASLTNNTDRFAVAASWYVVNFAFSSYTSCGGHTWESRSLFLLAKHTVDKDSVYTEARLKISGCSCCDCSFRPALLREIYLSSCWFWAVSFRTHAKGLWFILSPTTHLFLCPWFTKNTSLSVIKTLLYKCLDSAAQSLLLQRVTALNSLWSLATISDVHTSSVLSRVEHFMFCPEYA